MVVLVTGANGQLGQSLQSIAKHYPQLAFIFCGSSDLDISDKKSVVSAFHKYSPDYCINTAAYTAVDKAESEPEKAGLVNRTGAKNLAEACREYKTVLIHISTDFIFDGSGTKPYTETDIPNPTGVYGQSKLDGENEIRQILKQHYIIRTSWVYSQFGHNFMKTMICVAADRPSVSVVNDQIGTPTHAVDLADAVLRIVTSGKTEYGVYHFSNEGQCSWYDFAKKIFEINKIEIDLLPIPTSSYPTPAKRPHYSVLDKQKIRTVFNLEIQSWDESLKQVK